MPASTKKPGLGKIVSQPSKGTLKPKLNNIEFRVSLEGKVPEKTKINIYAFDSKGNFITSGLITQGGTVKLDLPTREVAPRIFVASEIPDDLLNQGKPTLELMSKIKAYEPAVNLQGGNSIILKSIPESIWGVWLFTKCRVKGKVVKPVLNGGATVDMPVCHARVHICEVDPISIVIPKLPDDIISKIKDKLKDIVIGPVWPVPPFPPEPDPWFRIDPSVIDPNPVELAKVNFNRTTESVLSESLNINSEADSVFKADLKTPLINSEISGKSISSNLNLNSIKFPAGITALKDVFVSDVSSFKGSVFPTSSTLKGGLTSLPSEVVNAVSSHSLQAVRDSLLKYPEVLKPYLCYWPWLSSYFYRCDELAVVETNAQGIFEHDIYYSASYDQPDLYFWVEYSIGGVWEKVYNPPVRCYTYWDYTCGTDVIIRVTDPRVSWCGSLPTLPGRQIAVISIGENISVKELQTAGDGEGLLVTGEPLGGSLEPRVFFGDDLVGDVPSDLSASGISYYRWSYRRLGAPDSAWQALSTNVVRHYSKITPDGHLIFPTENLGPVTVGTQNFLYKIQSKNPSTGLWSPLISARQNVASGFFQSHQLEGGNALVASGKYELKLELFDNLGNVVDFTNAGVSLKIPDMNAPFGASTVTTIDAPDYNRIKNSSGHTVAFRMVVHVDNNPCYAYMYDAAVGANESGPCGFIHYDALDQDVTLKFIARHPNNFASYSFNVVKGSSGSVPAAISSGRVGIDGTPSHNGYVISAGSVYTKNPDVSELVNCCGSTCTKAAFAESLYVRAWATDGWSTLSYLDASGGLKAFALDNE